MCEWLSQQEWSDVRLRCGGRSLPAHRAVLASASAFLRRLLLSSGTEETPTFIVLPDFDLEAMSSVLYYIYNGEVVIQKQKIEMFMEIVKAMQIFVDEDYLPSVCRDNAGVALASNVYSQTNPDKSKVFSLGSTGEGAFINIKRDVHIEQLLVRNIYNDKDSQDKEVRFDNGIQQPSSDTESVGDRQRSCFRRDLFVETYPRNGNANGRATRVLAIPSSRYRAATSVLSANANDKHRAADDFSSEMQKTTDALPNNLHIQTKEHSAFFAVSKDNRSLDFAAVAQFKNLLPSYTNPKLVFENNFRFSLLDNYSLHQSQILPSRLNGLTNNPLLNLSSSESSFIKNPFKTNKYISENPLHDRFVYSHYNESRNNVTKCNKSFNSLMSKGAILNQVMESPWCPRQPTNYRPSLRKPTMDTPDSLKKNTINDTNNNPKIALSPENVDKNLPINGTEEPNPETTISASDLKCAVCNQVFTDSESLSTHARRHSAPARYSCTECSKSFSQLRNFKYHMSIHRGTREFAATCTVCGKYFNDRGYLSSHMKIHRNRKEYKCSQCPKSFNQRVAYNMHVRIHTGIKPHVCGECGKAFSRKMLLKQHQRTHSGERPYACPHCDKRFADRSNMTLHLRLHSGIKPFSCTLCPKSFTKKHHLKSHLNFHTGSKPYSCPRCNLAFTQSSNMRTHYKKCTAPVQTNNAERPAVP